MSLGFTLNNAQVFRAAACIAIFLLIALEFRQAPPYALAVFIPIIVLLALYFFLLLLGNNNKVRLFLFSIKGFYVILCSLFFLGLCFTPINGFTRYLPKSGHPFNQYHWLVVSLMGILFSLSFLNYALRSPDGLWVKIALAGRKFWTLPTKHFLLISSMWVFAIANLFSYAVFEHIPHVQDEIAQLLQAKIFAHGSLTAPLPPIKEFFQYFYDNMIFTNRWFSQYPPGHPFLLMVGVLLNTPWIVNPLLASLSVPLLYKWAFYYYGDKEARLSVVLFCSSPFVLFMSSSFMNHVPALFFLLLFLYGLKKYQMNPRPPYAFLAGFSIGALLNVRTGEAVAIGAVFCGYLLLWSLVKKTYRQFAWFFLAAVMMLAVLLLYNYATNGDPFLFGYQVRWGEEHSLGFANKRIMDALPHTPLRGIVHTLSNFVALNQNLFEWPLPSLIPLAVLCMPGIFKKERQDYLLLCGLFAAPFFYFFYFYQDLCLGPRFYYISIPFILLLTARALLQIINGIAQLRGCPENHIKNAFIALLVVSLVFSAVIRIPKLYTYYADSFWEVDNRVMKKVQELGITNAVIFQQSYGYRGDGLGSGFLHNSPWLDTPIIFARDLGERNAELVRFFPDRTYYRALRNEKGEVIIKPLQLSEISH